jgi:hypothetical protein
MSKDKTMFASHSRNHALPNCSERVVSVVYLNVDMKNACFLIWCPDIIVCSCVFWNLKCPRMSEIVPFHERLSTEKQENNNYKKMWIIREIKMIKMINRLSTEKQEK